MHVLEAALLAHLVESPQKALSDYPPAEWREIQELLDAALDAPARNDAVSTRSTLSALFRRWFVERETRNCPAARNVA